METPNITETIRWKRAQFAGQCSRIKAVVRELVTWQPKHGQRRQGRPGRPCLTYPKLHASEFGVTVTELEKVMLDRNKFRKIVNNFCVELDDDDDDAACVRVLCTYAHGCNKLTVCLVRSGLKADVVSIQSYCPAFIINIDI